MFVCCDCGRVFSEPECSSEDRGEYFGFPAYEDVSGCPSCGGSYVETYRCDCCGEWIDTETYVEIDGERYCENCFIIKNLGE